MRAGRYRIATLIACSAVLYAGGASGALAQSDDDERERSPSGQVRVAGHGTVSISGRLTVTGNLPRRSLVRIVDREGDARVHVAGRQVALRDGRAVLRGTGIVFASGSDMAIMVTGPRLHLWGAGLGRVALRGVGRISLNQGPQRPWLRGSVRLAPPPRGARGAPARAVQR